MNKYRERRMPPQKPGRSKQDYSTPDDFMAAVVDRFGTPHYDLAAEIGNAWAACYFTPEKDSLAAESVWPTNDYLCWLNPPYDNIAPWAKKCLESKSKILFLTPASVGANWFQRWVMHKAYVLFLTPRLSFDGKNPYPKDCILSVFNSGCGPGFDGWKWK